MALTQKQTARYWREFAAVCKKQGWGNAEKEERRRELHATAGCPASMRDFDNAAFDRYLAECAGLQNRVDIRDRERERLVWRINADAKRAGLDAEYLARFSADLHGTERWEDLPLPQLENFRNAIHNRAHAKAPAAASKRPCTADAAPEHDAYEPEIIPAPKPAAAAKHDPFAHLVPTIGDDDDLPF